MAFWIAISIGASIALFIWQALSVVERLPTEDRAWRDRPPMGFRLGWALIRCVDYYGSKWYSKQRHERSSKKLTEAGLEFTLTSGQLIAGRWVSALVALTLTWLFLRSVAPNLGGLSILFAGWGYVYPDLWLKRVIHRRQIRIDRDLPFYLDVITLAVESGSNLTGSLTQAISKAPDSPLRHEFHRVLRDVRAGKTRAEALRELSDRASNAALSSVISGMIQAERSGSSLGPVLRAQANQLRNARFSKAEKRAMEAPVKLLAPLVIFIFPTTFIVLGFLVLSKMLQQGMISWAPIVWAYSWPG